MRRRTFLQGSSVLAWLAWAQALHAQGRFPDRPITFVVPFAAGGGGDVVARALAKGLSDRTGATVVVENRTGAGGNIGAAHVLKSAPNGYTLLNLSTTYAIQGGVGRVPFEPIADLQPVVVVSRDPGLLVVHPSSPIRSLKDLVAAAQAAPGKLTHGSAGIGSQAHLAMEDLAFMMGVKLSHVPYKGTSQAFGDLMGQHVDLMMASLTFGNAYLRNGRLRALGIVGEKRHPAWPDIPTFAEQGYPDFQLYDWKAVGGPKGMPAEVVAWLNREINEVIRSKAFRDKFEGEGTTLVGGTPEQMLQMVRSEIERWKLVAQRANVKLE